MTQLTIATPAPLFSLPDDTGAIISLGDFHGKKVVLYFYPKDDTPGCTAQACNLRDHYDTLLAQGYVILGISPDSVKKHQKFKSKYTLPFPLLSDEEHSVALSYGVWWPKKFMGRSYEGIYRTTFIIDETGIITHIIDDVDTKEHSSQILDR